MPLTPKNRKEEWLQGLVNHETTLTPKNRPEEWMKEIIDASGGGGGGGGGVLIVVPDDAMTTPPSWITDISPSVTVYETNVTYAQIHAAMTSSPIGLSFPGVYGYFGSDFRTQPIARFEDDGFGPEVNMYTVMSLFYLFSPGGFEEREATFVANAEDGSLYLVIERSM